MTDTNTPDLVDGFIAKKKAESQFLSLEDGESVKVLQLKEIKMVTKAGFGGDEKEVLRLKCSVETSEGARDKDFDNGTQRFAKELQEKGITIGSAFTITRTGLQTKTRYTLSEVTNPGGDATLPTDQVAPPAPSSPQVAESVPSTASPVEAVASTTAPAAPFAP